MWIFTVLPEWVTHLVFTVGLLGVIAGFVLGFIPFIKQYIIPIKIISLIVFAFGVYLEGGLADNKEWELKVKEVEAKVAKAEAESAKLNTELQAALTDRGKVIKEKGDTIIKYVDKEIVKDDNTCVIPKEFVKAHNDAAEQPK